MILKSFLFKNTRSKKPVESGKSTIKNDKRIAEKLTDFFVHLFLLKKVTATLGIYSVGSKIEALSKIEV